MVLRINKQLGLNSDPKDGSKKLQLEENFTIVWRNLSYKVNLKRWYHFLKKTNPTRPNEKVIFDNICGDAKSRQLTAIMGPSGAGKSSLLDCLFQNKTNGVTGQILVDKLSSTLPKNKRLKICYIPQHDYLNEWLTVREDLLFVSKLIFTPNCCSAASCARTTQERKDDDLSETSLTTYIKNGNQNMPTQTSIIDHNTNVLHLAELLGLNSCLDVPIKRISGGERKRLSVARELMSKPDILVLDEPTTGLDSLSCYKTMMVLKDLVKQSPNPMAVVVTIHQPEKAVFNLFDKTYFLSKGEGVVYDDDPKSAITKLNDVSDLSLPSRNYNPASYLIEISCDKSHENDRSRLTKHQRDQFEQRYPPSKIYQLLGDRGIKVIHQARKDFTNEFPVANDSDIESNVVHRPYNRTNMNFVIPSSKNSSNILHNDDIDTQHTEIGIKIQKDILMTSSAYYISDELKDCVNSHSIGFSKSFWQSFTLTHRTWLSVIRNPSLTKVRLAVHTVFPLVMLFVFGNVMGKKTSCPKLGSGLNLHEMRQDVAKGIVSENFNDIRYVSENITFYFILVYGFQVNIVSLAASYYPRTFNMFKKETGNGLYSAGPSIIGHILAELPLEIFFPSLSALLVYRLSGQPSSYLEWRMFTMASLVFLSTYFVQTIGLICGLIFHENVSNSVLVSHMSLAPFVATSGIIVKVSRMPKFLQTLSHVSLLKYVCNGVIAIRYGFNVCDCDEEKLEEAQNSFMNPQTEHVLDYLYPKENSTLGEGVVVSKIFEKLYHQFEKAQTYGMELRTCKDVRPYVMELFEVVDEDLYGFFIYCISGIIILKLVLYVLLKSSQH